MTGAVVELVVAIAQQRQVDFSTTSPSTVTGFPLSSSPRCLTSAMATGRTQAARAAASRTSGNSDEARRRPANDWRMGAILRTSR
ncbi:MAG TPA: hypothetical protein VGV61_09200 [Thermoanaerobaculia bacterium]|nr:hypothetical protein [Thermoanaerobaculia bacterium]